MNESEVQSTEALVKGLLPPYFTMKALKVPISPRSWVVKKLSAASHVRAFCFGYFFGIPSQSFPRKIPDGPLMRAFWGASIRAFFKFFFQVHSSSKRCTAVLFFNVHCIEALSGLWCAPAPWVAERSPPVAAASAPVFWGRNEWMIWIVIYIIFIL